MIKPKIEQFIRNEHQKPNKRKTVTIGMTPIDNSHVTYYLLFATLLIDNERIKENENGKTLLFLERCLVIFNKIDSNYFVLMKFRLYNNLIL